MTCLQAVNMLISAVKLGILTWGSMGIDWLLESASSGQSINCSFGTSTLASLYSLGDCCLGSANIARHIYMKEPPPARRLHHMCNACVSIVILCKLSVLSAVRSDRRRLKEMLLSILVR